MTLNHQHIRFQLKSIRVNSCEGLLWTHTWSMISGQASFTRLTLNSWAQDTHLSHLRHNFSVEHCQMTMTNGCHLYLVLLSTNGLDIHRIKKRQLVFYYWQHSKVTCFL